MRIALQRARKRFLQNPLVCYHPKPSNHLQCAIFTDHLALISGTLGDIGDNALPEDLFGEVIIRIESPSPVPLSAIPSPPPPSKKRKRKTPKPIDWTEEEDQKLVDMYFDMKDDREISKELTGKSLAAIKFRKRQLQGSELWERTMKKNMTHTPILVPMIEPDPLTKKFGALMKTKKDEDSKLEVGGMENNMIEHTKDEGNEKVLSNDHDQDEANPNREEDTEMLKVDGWMRAAY